MWSQLRFQQIFSGRIRPIGFAFNELEDVLLRWDESNPLKNTLGDERLVGYQAFEEPVL